MRTDNAFAVLKRYGYEPKTIKEVHDSARAEMKNRKLPAIDRDRARRVLVALAKVIVEMDVKSQEPESDKSKPTETNGRPVASRRKRARGMANAGVALDSLRVIG